MKKVAVCKGDLGRVTYLSLPLYQTAILHDLASYEAFLVPGWFLPKGAGGEEVEPL